MAPQYDIRRRVCEVLSCGHQIDDSVTLCPKCGASCTAAAPVNPQPTLIQRSVGAAAVASVKKAMILAILSAVLCELGLPALILAISAGKHYDDAAALGAKGGKMVITNICRLIGKILGILFLVFWVYVLIAFLFEINSSAIKLEFETQ